MRYQHENFQIFYSEQIKHNCKKFKVISLLLVKIFKIFDFLFTNNSGLFVITFSFYGSLYLQNELSYDCETLQFFNAYYSEPVGRFRYFALLYL